jgi:archaellum biogenesis protein FlaJ (TadC family)
MKTHRVWGNNFYAALIFSTLFNLADMVINSYGMMPANVIMLSTLLSFWWETMIFYVCLEVFTHHKNPKPKTEKEIRSEEMARQYRKDLKGIFNFKEVFSDTGRMLTDKKFWKMLIGRD